MSASRRAADSTAQASDQGRSNSAKQKDTASTKNSTSAPGNSTTLTTGGAATLNSPSYTNQPSSNIPMAEASADINRGERLFPPPSDAGAMRRSKQNATQNRRAGTMEQRLDYAVSNGSPYFHFLVRVTAYHVCWRLRKSVRH